MKRWTIGALAGACIGVGAYLVLREKPEPPPAQPEPPAAAVAPVTPLPAAPVVLGRVVEVADLDPLLDPPARPVTGPPFEPEPPTVPASAPAGPARIPPAID